MQKLMLVRRPSWPSRGGRRGRGFSSRRESGHRRHGHAQQGWYEGQAEVPRQAQRGDHERPRGPADPAGTFATNKATIFFDKNIVFNGKWFKECKPSNKSAPVGADVKAKCASSKVGGGKATGQATVGSAEQLTVTAYNGAAQANRPTAGSTCTCRARCR